MIGGEAKGDIELLTELLTVGECYVELASLHQRMKQLNEPISLLKNNFFCACVILVSILFKFELSWLILSILEIIGFGIKCDM